MARKVESLRYDELYSEVDGVLDGGGEVFIEVAIPATNSDPAEMVKQALRKRTAKDGKQIKTDTFRGDGIDTVVISR